MDKFTAGYIECALWASIDDDGEPLDSVYSADDLALEAVKQIEADCRDFQEAQSALLAKAAQDTDYSDDYAGHDFFLTRNGHGAGFWDRGLGDIGHQLTAACKPYGSQDLYVGDDGKIYCS